MAFRNTRDWIAKKPSDLWTSLFLLIFSGAVASEAYRLGLGSFRVPGPGFMIFGVSIFWGLLAVHLFLKSILAGERKGEYIWWGKRWKQTASVFVALTIYVFLLELVGYLLVTFFFLAFLFWIMGKGEVKRKEKWISIILVGAAFTSFVTYIVFSRWFALQFPKGLFRFF